MPASDALFDTLFFISRPSEFYIVLLLHPLSLSPIFFPDRALFSFYDMKKFFRRNPLPLFFLLPHRTKKY